MAKWIREIIISVVVLLILDAAYLTANMNLFENQIISVQRVVLQPRFLGMAICYLALIFGLNYFIISKNRPIHEAFLLGLVIYTVYDSTNYTIFKQWKPVVALMDSIWGGLLFALTTFITYKTA
jgi:uncharacterized membrane protein